MTTSLRDWVAGGFTQIYGVPRPADQSTDTFTPVFDSVVSTNVVIIINDDDTWTRDDFKSQVKTHCNQNATLVIRDVVEPLTCDFSKGQVGVNYDVIVRDKQCTDQSKQHRVFARAIVTVERDSAVQPTTPDNRRITKIEETRFEGDIFPSSKPKST